MRWRQYAVLAALLLLASLLCVRAGYLHIWQSDMLTEQGDNRHIRTLVVPAERGEIVDRNGELLAASAPMYAIWIDPVEIQAFFEAKQAHDQLSAQITQQEQLLAQMGSEHRATQEAITELKTRRYKHRVAMYTRFGRTPLFESYEPLAKALGTSASKIEEKVKRMASSRYAVLERRVTPEKAERVLSVDFPAVYSDRIYKRFYPAGDMTAPILGFVDINEEGSEGIEKSFNVQLAGVDGKRQVIRDRERNELEVLDVLTPVKKGETVSLSIDSRYQHIVFDSLQRAQIRHSADKAMAVLMSPKTGEILSLVSLPSFNPNKLSSEESPHWGNRAVRDLIEPGSTMKPLIAAAALQTGKMSADEKIDTPYQIRVQGKVINNKYRGEFDLDDIIAKSMNVAMVKISERLSDQEMLDMLGQLGFGLETQLSFPSEPEGYLPVEPLQPIKKATLSYGYGMTVSPVQLASAYSAIAGHGKRMPVTLIKRDTTVTPRTVFSADVADRITQALEATVDRGTGRRAQISGYRIAGKTGTAFKLNSRGEYDEEQVQTVFAGFAPVNDPEFVFVVIVDNPKGEQVNAGQVAAPIFAEVLGQILPMAGILPQLKA
ncbi:MAG: penicillin-binding protein 2, partial [Pseudomonadota bacterium]|nr:penicillin-binding protein 2 [Pseudomonadota bacterium]